MSTQDLMPVLEPLAKLEEEESYKDDFAELPPFDIVAYNELRSCADLLRMHQSGQLEIQPDFQRDVVWQKPAQTRFIDSLIKQLPIPSMCISLDYKTDRRLVIDGLQRMTSIIKFLSDNDWRLSDLEDIDERIAGKTVETIKTKTKDIYERVQNLTIPITVLRCDYSKQTHNDYLFTIFHRLNTGGNKLNNQEIRNCIYNGTLNTLLKDLAWGKRWVALLELKEDATYRFANEEMILRFFALHDWLERYHGKLAKFLNDYMYEYRNPGEAFISDKKALFNSTLDLISEKIFDNRVLPQMSRASLEGLLVGVSQNLSHLSQKSSNEVKVLYDNFRHLEEYSVDNLKEGLSGREKVKSRLKSSINAFSK